MQCQRTSQTPIITTPYTLLHLGHSTISYIIAISAYAL